MKRIFLALILFLVIVIIFTGQNNSIKKNEEKIKQVETKNITLNMKITSPAFESNQNIPEEYTCDSEGVNPQLIISDVPENAKSLVLIVDDPDAPSGTFTHWVLYNIDPAIKEIPRNSSTGVMGVNTTGRSGYVPPCPPSGNHRYIFKLYALDSSLDLPENADKNVVETAMSRNIINQAELIGIYGRQ